MAAESYEAIIIGAGQGGMPLARAFAGQGWKTALIERGDVGGTCINRGCTPTKTMAASARVAYLARRAGDYGVRAEQVSVDMAAVRRRKDELVASWRAGDEKRLARQDGLELLRGEARFTGPHRLAVRMLDGAVRELQSEHIVIDTGARPAVPELPGLDAVAYLDSTTIMQLDEVPGHLVILGGGYVAVEFGQMFRRFGSEVTIVQRSGSLLGREDPDVAEAVAGILTEDGIDLVLGADARSVAQEHDGGVALEVAVGSEARTLRGTHLLVATGRKPNTEALDLSAAGIQVDRTGHIPVSDRLETEVAGVYALGDVKGGPAFTHISYDDYRVIRANLLEGREATIEDRLVPYAVFIDPQLGRIGLTERECRDRGLDVTVFTLPMEHVARALEVDESRGLLKAVVDRKTDLILGFAGLGLDGGELMAMVEIAMLGGVKASALREGVFAHPTLAESLNNLFTLR